MKAFVWSLQKHLGAATNDLFQPSDHLADLSRDACIALLGWKMDKMAKCLHLCPYNQYGQFQRWLETVSDVEITPVHVLCPQARECRLEDCQPQALLQTIRERDISYATLLEGTQTFLNVAILTGWCPTCQVS
jgi:CxC5 like cysteine cluster associated with KDZ transposases